ncbi:MAG: phosphotransferase [Verrucomicrobiota bacterium]|nr:phosphotransferase [Verrucomicrobiota bacterium]
MRSFEVKMDTLLQQTRLRLPSFGAGEIQITPIEKGGSGRRFYRVRCSPQESLILIKYDLSRDENRHYVHIAEFLASHRIAAPKIYYHDAGEGLIWIEDLGEADLWSAREEPWMVRRAFYESALQEIARLHALPEATWAALRGEMPPEFTSALYHWEQSYFLENCLGRIFHVPEAEWRELGTLPVLGKIADELGARPRVLVHRDFQSQNVIMRNGGAYLIDFQGMRPGLRAYDVASLLYDPYVSISPSEREELLHYYIEMSDCGPDFRKRFHWCALQRLMQALGAYGYLGLVTDHPHFLDYVPAALRSLREVIEEIPGLDRLGARLATLPSDVPSH